MDQVLGSTAGNALEVLESVEYLTGAARRPRLHEVTLALAASLLVQGGLFADEDAARRGRGVAGVRRRRQALRPHGRRARRPRRLPGAPHRAPCRRPGRARHRPERAGVVTGMDCHAVGLVVTGLGGNRAKSPTSSTRRSACPRSRRPARRSARTPARRRACARRGRLRGGRARPARGGPRRRWGAGGAPRGSREDRVTPTVPKAELHVHLEGTAPPSLIRRLAGERNGIPLPEGLFADQGHVPLDGFPWTSSRPTTWRRA